MVPQGLAGAITSIEIAIWASVAAAALQGLRVRVRVRRSPRPGRRALPAGPLSLLSGINIALALASVPARAERSLSPGRPSVRPPWSARHGFPPPPMPERTRGEARQAHPAIHGTDEPATQQLFPRAADATTRLDAMKCHPAGKGITGRIHTVKPGETLWGIAATVLDTDDQRRIARMWPRIHRANKELIDDPDLLLPGQILTIPDEA